MYKFEQYCQFILLMRSAHRIPRTLGHPALYTFPTRQERDTFLALPFIKVLIDADQEFKCHEPASFTCALQARNTISCLIALSNDITDQNINRLHIFLEYGVTEIGEGGTLHFLSDTLKHQFTEQTPWRSPIHNKDSSVTFVQIERNDQDLKERLKRFISELNGDLSGLSDAESEPGTERDDHRRPRTFSSFMFRCLAYFAEPVFQKKVGLPLFLICLVAVAIMLPTVGATPVTIVAAVAGLIGLGLFGAGCAAKEDLPSPASSRSSLLHSG